MLALLAAGGYAWRAGYAPRFMAASVDDKLANAPRLSIVVLPFENLSGDKEQDYFADGDHRRSDDRPLASARQLRHLPQHRLHLQGQAGRREADRARARRALSCSKAACAASARTITVNAQLISTETGAHVWADRFEGERSKLGELQVEFVSRLANSLGVELVKAEALRAMRERPNNPDAVDLSMRGWAEAIRPYSKSSNDAAIGLFERALAIDPQLVPAMVGLATDFASSGEYFP